MKKISLIFILLVFAFQALSAKDLTGVKIYLNPGHGGFHAGANDETGRNDRNVPTIPFDALDENGFWESSCNLTKGLFLKDLLEKNGATVKISRTQNREIDDRDLKEISLEANDFNADFFLSIHSNAGSRAGGENYLLSLYNQDYNEETGTYPNIGKDPAVMAKCKDMAEKILPYVLDNNITVWNPAKPKCAEDIKFIGFTYGILRNLRVPGFILEGSFHDYEPECHRLLNKDYAHLSMAAVYNFICDYFGADKPATGIIAGSVKDDQRVMTDPRFNNWVRHSHDRFQPINGAKVTLMDAAGTIVKTYITDNYYNGVYVFWDLVPGKYTVKMEAEGYTTQTKTVELKAAEINTDYTLLNDPTYTPPAAIQGMPNIYASALKATAVSDGKYNVEFTLNADATAVNIKVFNGIEIVKTVELGVKSKGINKVELNITDIKGIGLSWVVEAIANPTTAEAPLKFTDDNDPRMTFSKAVGIEVDNSFESPCFGRIYVTEAEGAAMTNRTTEQGIFIYDPLFGDITNQGNVGYAGNAGFVVGNNVSPFRPYVDDTGLVYITDWTDSHSGVWIMDPLNPKADFKPVFGGTQIGSGVAAQGDVKIHGSISSCFVEGAGADRVLYTFDEDYDVAPVVNHCTILKYNIGNLDSPWVTAPSEVVFPNTDKLEQNANSVIVKDEFGGWWISQYRYTDNATIPSLIHVNKSGAVDYNSGGSMVTSQEGGMAVNESGNTLAMCSGDEIKIFDIAYDEGGKPTLTQTYTITPALGARALDLAFDCADNVYLATRDAGIGAWALPKANNSFETAAPSSMKLSSTGAGVDAVEADNVKVFATDTELFVSTDKANEQVKVYDVTGKMVYSLEKEEMEMTVDISGWTSGVYVVVVGDKVTKIIK